MKKSFLLVLMFLVASTFGFAQEWVGLESKSPVTIKSSLVSSTENEIVVDVRVGGYFANTVSTPEGKQIVVSGTDMAAMLVKGAPDLPMYPIPMIIGDRAEMEVSVVKSEYVDIQGVEVAPSKGNFSRQINPNDVAFEYGEMYQQDAFYPATQASLEAPYILRDFRGQNMMVYPYAYNPVTNTLRVYTHLVIEAKKVSDNGENQKVTRRSNTIKAAPEMIASYEHRFINYSSAAKYDFIIDEGEMLIVCVDDYMEALEPLVEWKNMSGRPTTMVPSSETGTLTDLKAYVQAYYDENPDFTYLLLVGEHENLPASPLSGGRSDNHYGMLEGNDFYEEVLVGRLPVKDLEDAEHQVQKIIYYERDMDQTATWATRAVGIGADEGAGHYGEPDYVHMDYIRDTLMHYTYTEVSQHYAFVNGPTAANMIADFNQGATVANYCNHGSPTSWAVADFSNSHVHQLTNDNKLPFIWSVACNNGEFQYDECFGEAWMRAKNASTGEPTGAIGGMFSWISQPWVPPMYGQDEMNAILTEWRDGYKHTLGGVSVNGNQFVLDMSPEDAGATHNTWILFGDPSMMVRTDVPQDMNVTCGPSTLLIGMSHLTVNADADFGIATLTMNDEVLASAYVENGVAELNFEPLAEVGDATLVVVGYNRVTTVMNVAVIPADGPYVVFDSYNFEDDNDQLDYGENVTLNVDIRNFGADPTSNVTVELSSESEYITLNTTTATVETIGAEEVASINDVFNFDVAVDVPNGTVARFNLVCSDGTDTWESSFNMQLNAPELMVSGITMSVVELLPGETAELTFEITNEGNSPAYNILAEVFSSSPDIEFTNTSATTETIAPAETASVSVELTVASSVEVGSVYDVNYAVSAGHYMCSGLYKLVIGSIMENFETGDFTAYPWEFENFNWVIDEEAYEGSYCAKSAEINDNQSTGMSVEVEVLADGEVSFYINVSSENSWDKLTFSIDGSVKGTWSGDINWEMHSFPITTGTHTLVWKYTKDSSVSSGDDCAKVDYISFPPVSIIESLGEIEDLTAEVEANTVSLSWSEFDDADEYIVRRNGEMLETTTEASYTDVVEQDGVYTYNVVARCGDAYSAPAFVTVNVGTVDVIEIETKSVKIYPNPTTGVVNVDIDGNYDVNVYNYQGQVVMKLNDNSGQIDMSGLTSGVYFMEIRTDNTVMVEKIIIK